MKTKLDVIAHCNEKFNNMDIWYIVDNFEQLKIIRGIYNYYLDGEKLSPRQAVRLYDFVYGEPLYLIYTKKGIEDKYVEIRDCLWEE